jgi:hypothetical protein
MIENEVGMEEGFHRAVAEVLECDSHYEKFPFGRRTRWNNRKAGNGRYIGHGVVRWFGPSHILVHLITPPVQGLFHSPDAALDAIRAGIGE